MISRNALASGFCLDPILHLEDPRMNDKRILAYLALALLICGLLGPFVIALLGSRELALGFGVVAEVLALIFGALSYSERIGKIVTAIGSVLALAALTITIVLIPMRARQAAEQRKEAMEQMIQARAHASDAMRDAQSLK
jgi:hypothetical protein